MAEFKKGDVVELKSGGPTMTVTYLNQNGSVQCQWFPNSQEKPMWHDFPPEALKKIAT